MPRLKRVAGWLAIGAGVAAAGYAVLVAVAWSRYGQAAAPDPDAADALLDRFIPDYEVVERHHVRVAALPEVTLAAALAIDLQRPALIRAIFRAREIVLGASGDAEGAPKGLRAQMLALGWGVLAEEPGREIVVGAVTQPWEANVVFRALPSEEFKAFREPGYVKIAWTLRADPAGHAGSMFRTETRAIATDATARARFRWYWARFSPGIILIRRAMLPYLKREAERLQQATATWPPPVSPA